MEKRKGCPFVIRMKLLCALYNDTPHILQVNTVTCHLPILNSNGKIECLSGHYHRNGPVNGGKGQALLVFETLQTSQLSLCVLAIFLSCRGAWSIIGTGHVDHTGNLCLRKLQRTKIVQAGVFTVTSCN